MTLKSLYSYLIAGSFIVYGIGCPSQSETIENKWTLVWSDEFETDGLPDPQKWSYSIGNGCPQLCGWGNNELQYYTEKSLENARKQNGILTIEAHNDSMGNNAYTSAKLMSKPSGTWQYGKMVIRAKLPEGRGVWPAIWMLPVENEYGNWPRSGEIDIMEHVGYIPDSIFGTVHTQSFNHINGTEQGGNCYYDNLSREFHVYSIEWEPDFINFQVNDKTYFTFHKKSDNSDDWPFDRPFYLILNLAVGGNWGGKKGIDPNIWPQQFEIDYVRVYQKM